MSCTKIYFINLPEIFLHLQFHKTRNNMNTPELRLLDIWQFVIEQKRTKPKMKAYEHIAEKVGITERNVRENIRKLVDMGYLVEADDWFATNYNCMFIRFLIDNSSKPSTSINYNGASHEPEARLWREDSVRELIDDGIDYLRCKLSFSKCVEEKTKEQPKPCSYQLTTDKVAEVSDDVIEEFKENEGENADFAVIELFRKNGLMCERDSLSPREAISNH
jgi:hypothetical protein